ncbi:MAG: ABC transporter permease [Gemmatimonadales bacterium]|nr:ABC transporter permease [Gemmatimonadales bacterium]
MSHDLRFALRRLSRTPGFTAAAVLCLGLGIGANTAIFTVINAVLLRPLPYDEPERLVGVWEANRIRGSERNVISPANYLDWTAGSTVFGGMAAVHDISASLTGGGEPEEVPVQRATASLFQVLGLRPALGRTLSVEDDMPGGAEVAVLSHGLWERRYDADPGIVGKPIHLDGSTVTVVGVMPPETESIGREPRPDIWIPMRLDPAEDYRETSGRILQAVARLGPGVTIARAQAEMATMAARLAAEHPNYNTHWSVNLVPLSEQTIGQVRRPLELLGGVVLLVLLIACGNVANLQLAQATARRREIAVHAALGASRLDLGRRLLAESVLVAAAGGALGVLLAWWCTDALATLASTSVPRMNEVSVDAGALAFTLVISLAAGIGFGLVPALHASRGDLHGDLKDGGRGYSSRGGRTRGILVGAQVASSLVLLVGAGLLLKSFARLNDVNLGFNPDKVLTARVTLGGERYEDEARQVGFFEELLDRVENLPGVRAVGAINWLPLSGLRSATRMTIEGEPPTRPGEEPAADVRAVDPGFFAALEIPVIRGRTIEPGDRAGVPRSVVVNQSFVARYLVGRDPLGRRIHMEWGDTLVGTVVGVVGDIKHTGVDSAASPTVYWALPQFPHNFMTLVIRTADDPTRLANGVVAQVRALDADQPVSDLKSYDEWLGGAVARRRFSLLLLGGFAALALALTSIGLYGITAYGVVQRVREFGIRLALGASQRDVLWEVLRQAMVVVGAGIAAGLLGAVALSRLVSSLLFEVSPTDPAVFVTIAVLLLAVGTIAGLIPARRATRVDPMVAIRSE